MEAKFQSEFDFIYLNNTKINMEYGQPLLEVINNHSKKLFFQFLTDFLFK